MFPLLTTDKTEAKKWYHLLEGGVEK